MLATVFKHLEFAKGSAVNGQPHPATHLLQTAYPTLDALLQQQVFQHIGGSLCMCVPGLHGSMHAGTAFTAGGSGLPAAD